MFEANRNSRRTFKNSVYTSHNVDGDTYALYIKYIKRVFYVFFLMLIYIFITHRYDMMVCHVDTLQKNVNSLRCEYISLKATCDNMCLRSNVANSVASLGLQDMNIPVKKLCKKTKKNAQ